MRGVTWREGLGERERRALNTPTLLSLILSLSFSFSSSSNSSVAELEAEAFAPPNLTIVRAAVVGLDLDGSRVLLKRGGGGDSEEEGEGAPDALPYERAILAPGATPRRLSPHPAVMVLRDADTVASLAATLAGARCVVVAGNGGIALGLAHALASGGRPHAPLRVVWAAKHGHVGDAFFDVDAAAFLAGHLGKAGEGRAGGERGGVLRAAGPAGAPAPLSAHAGGGTATPASTTSSASRPLAGGFGAAAGPGWVTALSSAAAQAAAAHAPGPAPPAAPPPPPRPPPAWRHTCTRRSRPSSTRRRPRPTAPG